MNEKKKIEMSNVARVPVYGGIDTDYSTLYFSRKFEQWTKDRNQSGWNDIYDA